MEALEYRILGPLEIAIDGRTVVPPGDRQRALAAFLVLQRNEVVSADSLADALWGARPPATAPSALRVYVAELRKLIGKERLLTRAGGYILPVGDDELDALRFERELAAARAEADTTARANRIERALALFRAEPLCDFRYADFAQAEIRRLDELRLTAREELVDARLELGRHAGLVAELERLVGDNPLRERLVAQLMVALYRSGRQAEALGAYDTARRKLAAELGIEPGPALKTLQREILEQRLPVPARTAAAAPSTPAVERRERKVVTCVFCDLVGFTSRAEELDPEDVHAILRPYHRRVRAELERFGGTVEKFIGDAVMAVFGAPAAHEDDAERAVRAALAIRDASTDELELRIGITTGEALVLLGAREGEGLAVGDVVNTASRLQAAAAPNTILVDETTRSATGEAILYAERDPVVAKGKSAPISVFEALEARSRFGVDVFRDVKTPLVGRASELATLEAVLRKAVEARTPSLVTLVGVPGIGKSRLVHELLLKAEAAPQLIRWRQGRSLPYGEGVSYWALSEMVRAEAGILETDDAETAGEKLHVVVGSLVPNDAPRVESELRPLLGLAGGDAGGDRGASFAAWRRFVDALANDSPLVLVFEDLHWADEGLLDFVEELAEWMADVPLAVVCTARPELLERRPGWGSRSEHATLLTLGPLATGETSTLLGSLLAQDVVPAGVETVLLDRSEGNPLYAEQYVRMLHEQGLLARENGGWRVAGEADLPLPLSIQSVIAARLDALASEAKTVLQDAAVIGKVFWSGAVAVVGARERDDVDVQLDPLERRDFVRRERRSSVAGEHEYAFGHVLVRDVAYGELPRGDRAVKHRLAAEWLEALGRRDERIELIAYHYQRALDLSRATGDERRGLADRARAALVDAAERAVRLASYANARRFYESALSLWPAGDPRGKATTTAALGTVLKRLACFDEARRAFADAEALLGLEPAEDDVGWWRAWLDVADHRFALHYWLHEMDEMERLAERMRQHIDEVGSPEQRMRLYGSLAMLTFTRDRFVPSDETMRFYELGVGNTGDDRRRFQVGMAQLWRGDLDEGETNLEAALAAAERMNDGLVRTRCLAYLAMLYVRRRDRTRARELADRVDESDTLGYYGTAEAARAWLALEDGDLDDAERHGRNAVADWALEGRSRPGAFACIARFPLMAVALARGNREEAQAQADAILDPTIMRLPDDLTEALASGELERALDLARKHRYV